MSENKKHVTDSKKINSWIVVFLSFFLGVLGAHRFYVGRWKTGLLMFFTMGGFFIWWIVDFLIIYFRGFSDAEGNLIMPPQLKIMPPQLTPRHKEISWWLFMGFFTIPLIYLGGNWIFFGCPVVVIIGLLGWNASKCPHCKQAFSTKEINRILVDSYQATKTVKVKDKILDNKYNTTGYIEREEQRLVTNKVYDVYNKCTKCSKEWVTKLTTY